MQNILNSVKIGDVFKCIIVESNPFLKSYYYNAKINCIYSESIIISGPRFSDIYLRVDSGQIINGNNYSTGILNDRIIGFSSKL
jgi:hypothetical protein